MTGHGKPKLHTKFEVASFSRCTNNNGEPQIFWSSPNPRLRKLYPLGVFLRCLFSNPSCTPNLTLLASSIAEIIIIIFGSFHVNGSCPLVFFGCVFMMGLCKCNQHTKCEVATLSHCGNNIGEPPNITELP